MRERWRIAKTNIDLCFVEKTPRERDVLLRAHRLATWESLAELCRAWFCPYRFTEGIARVHGLKLIEDAVNQGRGVLLLTGHFMHTEMALRLISESLGSSVYGVVRRNGNPYLEAILEAARVARVGPTIGKFDVLHLVRELREGAVVVYSADQDFREHCSFVPFFGIPAATLNSVPRLCESGNALPLVMWSRRRADFSYEIRIQPIWSDWASTEASDSAAVYMRELESEVRQNPAQYLWSHRRFKTRPEGAPDLYSDR